MNKAALLTMARKFQADDDLYLVSIFDLEPSGIIIHAYNQINSTEYVLPVSEMELSVAGITRHVPSLKDLLSTVELVIKGATFVLESSNEKISKIKQRPTGNELEVMLKTPMMGEDSDSIQELLVTGLMQLCKMKPSGNDAVKWLGDWLIENNPNKPTVEDSDE